MRGLYPKPSKLCRLALTAMLAFFLGSATGCAEERTVSFGGDGLYAVRLIPRTVRVRVDEHVDVNVFVPTEDAELARGRPVVVLVHGGLVAPHRYEWLAVHLAARGFVVLVPSHPLDLALLEQENAIEVLRVLRRRSRIAGDRLFGTMDDGRAALIGHSLGGVVSAALWDAHEEDVDELVLIASYPSSSTLRPRSSGRALSILGTQDARVTRMQAEDGARALATSSRPVDLALVEGMNHMQVVDDLSADEAASAGINTIDDVTARARVTWLIDALLAPRRGGTHELLDDERRWPEGIERGGP